MPRVCVLDMRCACDAMCFFAYTWNASDLDVTTQKQLARGQRLRELLKQPPPIT
jgi:hypothetical protein